MNACKFGTNALIPSPDRIMPRTTSHGALLTPMNNKPAALSKSALRITMR